MKRIGLVCLLLFGVNLPAPAAGLGFESNKFDPAAIEEHFANYPGPLLKALGPEPKSGRGLTTLHFDSWKMSSQNCWEPSQISRE